MVGQRNGGVDVLRLLMALCVVINHSCILGHYFQNVLEMPVPVFLMLSGYFFNTDDSVKEKNKSKKQLIKIGKLTAFSYVFYIFWHIVWNLMHAKSLMLDYSTFYTCTNLFAPHIWYLHAYFLMLCFVCLLHRFGFCFGKIRCRFLLFYIIISYLIFHISYIPPLIEKVFGYCLTFFLVGICIKRLTTNRTYSVAGMLLCLSLCGCILNQIFDIDNIRYSFFTIMASIFAVMVAITLPIKTSNIFARAGKNLSLYVYIFHWAVLDVINTYMVSNECSRMLLYSKAILLVMISLVVAFVFTKTETSKYLIK